VASLHAVEVIRREQRQPLITADGSSIRELAPIPSGNAANQSLAEAVVPAAGETIAHLHLRSEEIYLFTGESGRMRLGDEERPDPLVVLCCCAPAYSHADTVLLED
jgi:mannose-6-phosphate isomerase-like protein (cupin superfamily)